MRCRIRKAGGERRKQERWRPVERGGSSVWEWLKPVGRVRSSVGEEEATEGVR
jgi:hypothetical protein